MGAKAWFIAYFDDDPKAILTKGPKLDREASRTLAGRLFPGVAYDSVPDGSLSFLNPDSGELLVGDYGGLRVVAHEELGGDYPSKIDRRWLEPSLGRTAYLHAQHSVVDWFAFGLWRDGQLIRALSLSPDNGIQEQIGEPASFEKAYWDGEHPMDDYPLPFHPLEMAEASLFHHLGFQFEYGNPEQWACNPDELPIAAFKAAKSLSKPRPKWKFW